MSNGHVIPAQLSAAFARQRNREVRLAAQQAQLYSQLGRSLVTNNGTASESVVSVTFVHPFTEEPNFTCGAVMDTRQQIYTGTFPTASAIVQGWATDREGGSLAYLGATIAVVTTGLDGQKIWIHYRFEGNALSFPYSS